MAVQNVNGILDIDSIVGRLMAIEQRPLLLLARNEASYQARLSAFGSLKGALSKFQSAASTLAEVSRFQAYRATSSDATAVAVSASGAATAGTYAVEIAQLAQAQKLAAAGQASTVTAIGSGTITFEFGTISGGTFDPDTGRYTGATFIGNGEGVKTVTIGASDNTLSGIRDAINRANIGVIASIVNDGDPDHPYRLVLSSQKPGASNSIRIAVTGDAGLENLLAHDPAGTQNLSETVTAKDAILKIDGLSISARTNTVTEAIPGVTLNLLETTSSPVVVSVAHDVSGVQSAIEGFVNAYNDLVKTLRDLTAYNPETRQPSVLTGDSGAQAIQRRLRSVFNSVLSGVSGSYTSLAQIGLAFRSDGSLAIDSGKLQNALAADRDNVAALFAAIGYPTDSLIRYAGSDARTQPGTYGVNVTQLATQGRITGSVAIGNDFTITAGLNDTLTVQIDGVEVSITLTAKTYATPQELAAELQSRLNGAPALANAGVSVSVSQSGGILTLLSNRYGSASSVSVSGGNAASSLFGTPDTTDAVGKDVAGNIGGMAATGSGQYLTGAEGSSAAGLRLLVSGGTTGERGVIHFSQGVAYRLARLLDEMLDSDGLIATRTDGIHRSLEQIADRRRAIEQRLELIEKRYRAQFIALDAMLTSMNQTSNFLAQQLANLPKIDS